MRQSAEPDVFVREEFAEGPTFTVASDEGVSVTCKGGCFVFCCLNRGFDFDNSRRTFHFVNRTQKKV